MGGYFHICPSVDLPGLSGHSAMLWGQQDDAFGNFCSALFLNSDSQMTLSGSPLLCGGDITLDGNNISLSGNNTTIYSTCSSDLFTINFYNPGDVGIGTTGPGNFSVLHLRYNDKVSCATELSTVEMALTGDLCVTGSVWSDSLVNVYGNQSICCNLSIVGIGGTGDPAEGCCAVFNLKSDCANSEIQLCTGSTNCFSKPLIEFKRSRDECYANDILTTTCSGDILGEINFKGVDCWQGYSQTDLYQHSLGVSIQAIQTDIPCYAINHVPAKLNINIPSVSGGQVVDSSIVFSSNNGDSIISADTLCVTNLVAGNTLIPYDNVTCAPLLTSNLGYTNEVVVVSANASNERIVVSTPVMEIDDTNQLVCFTKYSEDCTSPNLKTLKTRGSGSICNVGIGTTGLCAVKTCDDLFVIDARGYDGSNIQSTGKIKFSVDTYPGGGTSSGVNVCPGQMPTSLSFYTGSAATSEERLNIDSCGCITFNNAYSFPLTSEDTDNNTFLSYNSSISALEFSSFSNVDWTLYSSNIAPDITESVVNEITANYFDSITNSLSTSLSAPSALSGFSRHLLNTSPPNAVYPIGYHLFSNNGNISIQRAYQAPESLSGVSSLSAVYQVLTGDNFLTFSTPLVTGSSFNTASATLCFPTSWSNYNHTIDLSGYDYNCLSNKTCVSFNGIKGIEGGGDISSSRTFCLSGQALCLHDATFSNSSLLAKDSNGTFTSVATGSVANGSNDIPTSNEVFTFVASVSDQGNVNIDHSTVSFTGVGGIDNASLGDITTSRTVQLSGQARCIHDLSLSNGSLIAKDSNGNYVSVLSSTFMDDTNTVYDPWILSASDTAGCFEVQSGCQVDFVGNEGIDVCRSNEQVFFSLSDNARQLHDLSLGVCKVIVTNNSNNITQVNNCITVSLTGLSGDGDVTLGGTLNIGHANTSNQASIASSSCTYINSVTLDDYGHVTGLTTGTETGYCNGYGLSATGTEFGIDTDVLDALYLDNTNNFLTGGTFDGVSATFTKNDNTTFKVDLSGYDYSKLSNKPTLSTGTVQGSGTVGTIPIWKTNTTTLGDSLISANGADQYCFSKEVNSDLIFTIRNTCDTGTGTLQFCNDDNSCCGYIRKFGTSNSNTDCNNILKVYNDGGIRIFENTGSGIMLHGSQVGIGNTTGDIPLANGYDLTILGHTSASGNIVTQSHVCGAQVYDNGNRVCTSAVQLDELSVGANATASGSGGLAYNSTSGVFTYTPPVIPTDTNNYLSAASFNTSDGVLTLGRHNLTNVAVDLDGKYAEGHVETTVNSNSANWNTAYGWGDHSTEGYCKTHTHSSFTCLDLTTSSTTSAMAIAYRDQFKKTYTTQVSWCHQACGVQHFNLIFPYNNSSQGYMYDFKLVTDRNSTYQNFGFIRDNSYIYIEGDGDFLHRQEGLLQAGGTYSNSITLQGNPTVIRSDSPSATTTGGTSPYDYFIVRYPILFPNNNSGTAQVFVHVDVYSQNDGATVAFLKT